MLQARELRDRSLHGRVTGLTVQQYQIGLTVSNNGPAMTIKLPIHNGRVTVRLDRLSTEKQAVQYLLQRTNLSHLDVLDVGSGYNTQSLIGQQVLRWLARKYSGIIVVETPMVSRLTRDFNHSDVPFGRWLLERVEEGRIEITTNSAHYTKDNNLDELRARLQASQHSSDDRGIVTITRALDRANQELSNMDNDLQTWGSVVQRLSKNNQPFEEISDILGPYTNPACPDTVVTLKDFYRQSMTTVSRMTQWRKFKTFAHFRGWTPALLKDYKLLTQKKKSSDTDPREVTIQYVTELSLRIARMEEELLSRSLSMSSLYRSDLEEPAPFTGADSDVQDTTAPAATQSASSSAPATTQAASSHAPATTQAASSHAPAVTQTAPAVMQAAQSMPMPFALPNMDQGNMVQMWQQFMQFQQFMQMQQQFNNT